MKALKKIARSALHRLPDEGRSIKNSLKKILMQKELAASKLAQRVAGMTLPDPRTVFHIDPRRIAYATCQDNGSSDWEDWVLPQRRSAKHVLGGDWDLLRHRVGEMRVVAAVRARVEDGTPWPATEYYQTAVRQIESGRMLWGCTSRTDFDRRCAKVDTLIAAIQTGGYRVHATGPDEVRMDTACGQNEVLINLSRDGLPLFQDGRHRLAIALALQLPTIPVQVFVRHAEWQTLREFLWRMARGSGGASKLGFLYQRPVHFDLAEVPAEHGCEDRWEAIAPHLPSTDAGRALDIGCNLGFICHRLEAHGFAAVGVENRPDVAHAARRIARAEGRSFQVLAGDVLDEATLRGVDSRFDVVMALNIFHHFIKTEAGYHRLQAFLRRLSIGTMFFEPHQPDDPQMQAAYANPSPAEFADLVRQWAGLRTLREIYRAGDNRLVFCLSR